MKRLIGYFVVTLLSLMLTACGFHLRGTGSDKIEIKEMAVTAGDRYGELAKELDARLRESGVAVRSTAMYRLDVSEEWEHRVLSYSSSIRGADTGNVLTLHYRIYGPGNLLLIESAVEARGEYISDTNNIVANELQEAQVKTEVTKDAVNLLIDRLQVITSEQLATLQIAAEEQARLQAEAEQARQRAREQRRRLLLQSIPLEEIERLNEQ